MSAVFYAICLAISMPVMAIVSCAIYVVVVPSVYVAALARVLVLRPAWLPDPPRWPRAPEESDPGVLQYFYGPALADVAQTAQAAFDDCRRRWRLGIKTMLRSPRQHRSPLAAPLNLAGAAGMTAGTLIGAVAIACCLLLHGLVVVLSAVLVRVFSAALRGTGSAILRTRNTRMTCPACCAPVPYPGYSCPGNGCKRRHHDLLPGRFGVLRRRCRCGTSLRTAPFPGSSRAAAFCPRCDQPLEDHPGVDRDITLPVFGTSRSARAQLLLRIVNQLRTWDREGQLTAIPADPAARELGTGDHIAGSSGPSALQHAPPEHAIRLLTSAGTRILRAFDAADEESSLAGHAPETGHASQARTFILALDPLSADSFWARLPDIRQAELESERSAGLPPDQAYERAHRFIEAMGVPTREARLAVVFTRGDLSDASSGRVSRWARRELGLGDLVRSARRDFRECRFFCTAEPTRDETLRAPAASLIRWLLAPDGISPSLSRVVADFRAARERSYRWHRRYVFASMVTSAVLLLLLFAR